MRVPFVDLWRSWRKDDLSAIQMVIDSGEFVRGHKVQEFEESFAKEMGFKYGVGVNSGTDALAIAIQSVLGLGPGEIITPANTFIATAEAILMAGFTPVSRYNIL